MGADARSISQVVGGGRRRRTAAERLIGAVADDVDMARYDEPHAAHTALLRRASEARGLDIVESPPGFVAMRGQRAVFGSTGMAAPSTSVLASRICKDKLITMRLLRMAGVPVPEGRSFGKDERENAIEYATGLGWPVVLKPSDGSQGKGVVVGIRSDDELRSSWRYAIGGGSGSGRVLVQREHDGIDVRVYVVGDEAVAAIVRLPAYVRGDGESTVEALVEDANQERLAHPHLARKPIVLDEQTDRNLTSRGLTRRSVPQLGETVLLRRTANISLGGVSVEVTDELPVGLLDAAVKAMAAIPGLEYAGVDFLVPEIGSADGAVVLEVSSRANICGAHFPAAGEPRDVAGAIVDRALAAFE